ncbi:hypothetical protein RclHR1_00360013 [Rhizophagus clarus]|uniref:Zinc finger protein VAR3, chloroplastic n=1 Tax=Rhizophagus clarus TaxID=94130 RepID=A0A2Z6RN82_9GLOM|nr:hypothetical protein RclHR1_00360013 [Rhizophagus clarus]GES93283.1 zinc finger protein VAR3, chloroplastic [Rhizophagus clarus]
MLRHTRLLLQRATIFVRQITLVSSNNNSTLFSKTNGSRILPTLTMAHVRRNIYRGPPSRDDRRPGDWICEKCGFKNFSYRNHCFSCDSKPKYREVAAGDWICPNCEFYNFQSRSVCFKCSTPFPDTDKNEEKPGREF